MSTAIGEDQIEQPECELGYPLAQVERIVGADRMGEFDKWFRGKTGAICEGRLYDHEAKAYHDTGCGPHGYVVYGTNLRHFLARRGPA